MVVNKRKKNSRQRGTHTHGWGSKKKHRGAGHRGGRGKAGSGAKGDAKKPRYWKDKDYFGKKGFTSLKKVKSGKPKTINLSLLETKISEWISKGIAVEEKGVIKIDLSKTGYSKLLGTGKINRQLEVTVKEASAKAKSRIEEAKGKVLLSKKQESESKAAQEA